MNKQLRQRLGLFGWMLAAVVAMAADPPSAQSKTPSGVPKAWGDWPRWGDQGDGTDRNPVLPADYSDLDCIRVGGLLGLRLEPTRP